LNPAVSGKHFETASNVNKASGAAPSVLRYLIIFSPKNPMYLKTLSLFPAIHIGKWLTCCKYKYILYLKNWALDGVRILIPPR
jgi:hypothetical protein